MISGRLLIKVQIDFCYLFGSIAVVVIFFFFVCVYGTLFLFSLFFLIAVGSSTHAFFRVAIAVMRKNFAFFFLYSGRCWSVD